VIPLATSYTRATSVDEALAALRGGAKPIAGGQSLVPMMRLRLASPDALVDLSGIPELTGIRQEGSEIVIGAMTRHRAVATSAEVQRGARQNGLRLYSMSEYTDLEKRDAELVAHAEFRKHLYAFAVVAEAKKAAAGLG